MKFTVDYPIVNVGYDRGLVTAAGMTRIARAAEQYGYDAICLQRAPGAVAQMAQRRRPRVAAPDLGPGVLRRGDQPAAADDRT